MRKLFIVFIGLIVFGCAKVSVQTPEPIKVDINMRVDVYQHVVQDVESINDQIYGTEEKNFNSIFSLDAVYAQDFSSQASQAISRRRARLNKIEGYFAKGYIGENRNALLEIRGGIPASIKGEVKKTIEQENSDRNIIYEATAQKNNTNAFQVRKVFFEDDYKRAPAGYLFETESGEWIAK